MIKSAFIFIFNLACPLLLIPIEKVFPYPHWIEEAFKLIIVLVVLKLGRDKSPGIAYVVISGLIFSLSESVFYLSNLTALNKLPLFFLRFGLTAPLHMGTMFVMYWFGKKSKEEWWGLFLGYLLAVAIHYSYNFVIGVLL